MGLLGNNGGLIGKNRLTGPYISPGLWTSSEQSNAVRLEQWPIPLDQISDLLLLYRGSNGETFIGSDSVSNNTIIRTGSGSISNAYSKEGSTSYYSTATSSKLKGTTSITYSGDFTWQCWWYPEFYQNGYKALFGVEGAESWSLFINDDGSRPLFLAKHRPGFSMILDGSAGGVPPLNEWNHVALTRSGSDLRLWFNGKLRASTTYTTTITGIPIVAEWGSGTGYLGYIDVTQMINGIALYTLNFTPPTAAFPDTSAGGDLYFLQTSLLLHMDGANGSTTFTDSSLNTVSITVNGNTQISTAQSKFGGASAVFDGTGDFLITPTNSLFSFNTNDFTIEMWVYSTGGTSYRTLAATRPNSGGYGDAWSLGIGPSNELYFYSNGFIANSATGLVLLNTWHHVAITRSGTSVRMFLDGVSVATGTNSQSFTQRILAIGALQNGAEAFTGYIDDLRITKGAARYTSNFTPPTSAFPEQAPGNEGDPAFDYNSLLLHMDGTNGSTTFTDNSPNALTVTANGNAQISTAQSKFGGASAVFDGTGDYLTLADSSLWDLPADFTIEAWVKASATGFGPIVSYRDTGAAVNPVLYLWNTGVLVWYYNNAARITGTTNIVGGNFYHVAVCRSGGSTRLFVNGIPEGVTYANSDSYVADGVWIGAIPAASQYLNGYIDDLRITKGFARYTGAFVPSAKPYTG